MTELRLDQRGGRSKWQVGLESVSSVLLIVVSLAVLWVIVGERGTSVVSPALARSARPTPAPPKLPTEPISLDGAFLKGSKNARVAVIEYSDFQCPYCGRFARETLPSFEKAYVDSGKVLFAFNELPLESIHPFALKAAESAECASRQGQFWRMHDALFSDQQHLDAASLLQRAKTIGLDEKAFESCVKADEADKIRMVAKAAAPLSVTGTPTFFVGTIQGDGRVKATQRLSGTQTLDQLRAAIEKAVADATTKG